MTPATSCRTQQEEAIIFLKSILWLDGNVATAKPIIQIFLMEKNNTTEFSEFQNK